MSHFDEALELSARNLVELNDLLLRSVLNHQLQTANYLLPPKQPEPPVLVPDRPIVSNNQFWELILRERLWYGMTVKLESFFFSSGFHVRQVFTIPGPRDLRVSKLVRE